MSAALSRKSAETHLSRSKTDSWVIRDATAADLPAVIDIYNAAIATRLATAQLEPVTVESRRSWLSDHSPNEYPFWVLEMNGKVAGWLTFKSFLPRCAYRGTAELSVYVDEQFRRRGDCPKVIGTRHRTGAKPRNDGAGRAHFRAQRTEHSPFWRARVHPLGPSTAGRTNGRNRTRPDHHGATRLTEAPNSKLQIPKKLLATASPSVWRTIFKFQMLGLDECV